MKEYLLRVLVVYGRLTLIGAVGTAIIIGVTLLAAIAERDNGWNSIGIAGGGVLVLLVFHVVLFTVAITKTLSQDGWVMPTVTVVAIIVVPVIFTYVSGYRAAHNVPVYRATVSTTSVINAGLPRGNTAPPAAIRDNIPSFVNARAEITDLPATNSLVNSAEMARQDIRLLEVDEVDNTGLAVLIKGKGYATVNGGAAAFFWGSTTPPRLEITLNKSNGVLSDCVQLLKDHGTSEQAPIQIVADGFFSGNESLGVFSLGQIDTCGITKE